MSEDRIARVRALGKEHARVETEGDLPATMATLVADPVYEFLPVGGLLKGRDKVQAYYEHLIGSFLPNVEDATLVDDWCNENALVEEYAMQVRVDGKIERHRVTGILVFDGDLMTGERIWGSERALRLMLGDALFDALEPFE